MTDAPGTADATLGGTERSQQKLAQAEMWLDGHRVKAMRRCLERGHVLPGLAHLTADNVREDHDLLLPRSLATKIPGVVVGF